LASRYPVRAGAPSETPHYQRDFTSTQPLDENYYQREDTAYTVGIDSTVQIRKGIELRADYDRIDRTSNKSGANLEFGNYTEQRVTVGAEYRF
jgi:hypothetical protein